MNRDYWNGKLCFITGVNGFIGSHLAKTLIKLNAKVIGIAEKDKPHVFGDFYKDITFIKADIRKLSVIDNILGKFKPDSLFHLASKTIVQDVEKNLLDSFETNITGTINLLEAARRHMDSVRRIIITTSDKAYGFDKIPYDEIQSPLSGIYPYACSKSCADLIAQTYFNTYNLPIRIIRCCNVYGGGDYNFSRIIPRTISNILKCKKPVIYCESEKHFREFIFIDDAILAILLIAESIINNTDLRNYTHSQDQGFCAYNVGTNMEAVINIKDLVVKILKLMGHNGGENEIEYKKKPNNFKEVSIQYLNINKFLNLVKQWTPLLLDVGLTSTIEWYRKHIDN